MNKKINLIETMVFIINVLVLISIYVIKFTSDQTEYLFLAIILAIMILSNMFAGVMTILISRVRNWKTVALLLVYLLQIVLYISLIVFRGTIFSDLICACALASFLLAGKLAPAENGHVDANEFPS